MARPLRLEFPGALYHVTARANARQAIVLDDRDRALFILCLGDAAIWLDLSRLLPVGSLSFEQSEGRGALLVGRPYI